jgi:hypothetical protein
MWRMLKEVSEAAIDYEQKKYRSRTIFLSVSNLTGYWKRIFAFLTLRGLARTGRRSPAHGVPHGGLPAALQITNIQGHIAPAYSYGFS